MPFTNTWDVTFPPDTQLANLLGQDLRNFRVDTQQRMAAISGVDASKPAFGADAQPANWNGILFFATDTGKIYQFNNPAWTDITGLVSAGSRIAAFSIGQVFVASSTYFASIGNILPVTFENQAQLPMPLAGRFMGITINTIGSQPASGSLVFTLRKNGVSQALTLTVPANGAQGTRTVTGSVSFAAGDLIDVMIVNNATSGSAQGSGAFLTY